MEVINVESDHREIIWTYSGMNVNGVRPMNLSVGVIMFVKKIFDDPSKPEVQNKIIEFKEKVEAAKICGYSVRDVSKELFGDMTTINNLEEAIIVADKQMNYVKKTNGKGRR